MPGSADVIEGVLNLHGRICSVVDLRKCFDVEISDSTDEGRIVIVGIDGKNVGVIVGAVGGQYPQPVDHPYHRTTAERLAALRRQAAQ